LLILSLALLGVGQDAFVLHCLVLLLLLLVLAT
jgi:hypothetical protein